MRDDVAPDTAQGDSDIEPRPLRTPADVPMATANVLLLGPFPAEATGITILLQSMENMALLGVAIVLMSPHWHRRRHRLIGAARRYVQALRVLSISYLLLFVYAFSGMYNLGIMSRQRTQATLFVLLLLATSLVSKRRRGRTPKTVGSQLLVLHLPPESDESRPPQVTASPIAPSKGPLVLHEPRPAS